MTPDFQTLALSLDNIYAGVWRGCELVRTVKWCLSLSVQFVDVNVD